MSLRFLCLGVGWHLLCRYTQHTINTLSTRPSVFCWLQQQPVFGAFCDPRLLRFAVLPTCRRFVILILGVEDIVIMPAEIPTIPPLETWRSVFANEVNVFNALDVMENTDLDVRNYVHQIDSRVLSEISSERSVKSLWKSQGF